MRLFQLRAAKLSFALSRPRCWRALRHGVAPSVEHRSTLATLDPDLLLDVGANRGQFSLWARTLRPGLRIHAYEPLPAEAVIYRKVMGHQPGVELHELALGATPGKAELHVSRRADSSSLLPIGRMQTELFPSTEEVGTVTVQVATLDSLREHWISARRALLKLDVQGFELSVLQGAKQALQHCRWVYAECSHVPLYGGQALYPEVEQFLAGEGFRPVRQANEQHDRAGQLIQADYLFERSR